MGMDIDIGTDCNKVIFTPEYVLGLNREHTLSRTFCNFMCRHAFGLAMPELDQIGQITETDISPLYEMEQYGWYDEADKNSQLEFIASEEEKLHLIKKDQESKEKLKGNIKKVYDLLSDLIRKLSVIEDLQYRLNHYGHDSLRYMDYFTDFNQNKGDGYIDNNFGQDLRNFKLFLEYAQSKGATTVYFRYG